jgi:uncharacterized protein YcbX
MSATNSFDDTIVSLNRYPVKSMVGEQLNAVDVTKQGFLGDRVYAIIDSIAGTVATAKNLRTFPGLLDCLSSFVDPPKLGAATPPVRIILPNGTALTSLDPKVPDLLSEFFGREVTLSARLEKSFMDIENPTDIQGIVLPGKTLGLPLPSNTFFDAAPLLILTTSTLDHLRALYPEGRFEIRRFRPNIVVEPTRANTAFIENSWIGKTVSIGDGVRLRVIGACSRCVMTTLPQGDLPRDPGILRTIAQYTPKLKYGANLGVYATVEREGRITRGDGFRIY